MRGRTATGFIQFRDDTRQNYTVPNNTMDPRYLACVDHHPACDCREAELHEELDEHRHEREALRKAVLDVLASHPAFAEADDESDACQCTGCQIARRVDLAYLVPLKKEVTP